MTDAVRVRVMLVSSFPVVRSGLRGLLDQRAGLEVVGEATSPVEAAELARQQRPDIVLVDPDSEAISLRAVAAVSEACECRVLVFTGDADHRVCARAIELGAAGVVTKEQPAEILLRAIRKIFEGELWLDRVRTATVLTQAMRRGRDPELMKIDSLTRREREIVALVSDGLRNAAIAERLFISEATVRNHLTSILSKLALTDRFDLAVYAFRQGLDRPAELSPRRLYREEHPPPRHQSADRDWAGRDRTE